VGVDPPARRALASTAASAGAMLAAHHGRPAVVRTKSSATDVVTEMDPAAERMIRELILAERPGDAILGEEGGQTGAGAPVRWIVDPLDGTVNYLYGLPDWAVSVAAEVDGTVVAGAVCVPRRKAPLAPAVSAGGPGAPGWTPPTAAACPRLPSGSRSRAPPTCRWPAR
jgi:myo-inositol-1(or 4)-monophosphatase